MIYSLLADFVVFVHLAYVSYVLFGQLLIMLGCLCGWKWIRNIWFRASHLVMILIVAVEAMFAIECPLTGWEYDLRMLAGQEAGEGSFVGRLLDDLLFYDAPADHPAFFWSYVGFAALVLAFYWLAPPRLDFAGHLLLTGVFAAMGGVFLLLVRDSTGLMIGLSLMALALTIWFVGQRRQKRNPA